MNMHQIGQRFCLVGGVATGIIGLLVGINASNDGSYWQSGICLIAAAIAFGAVGYVFSLTRE